MCVCVCVGAFMPWHVMLANEIKSWVAFAFGLFAPSLMRGWVQIGAEVHRTAELGKRTRVDATLARLYQEDVSMPAPL